MKLCAKQLTLLWHLGMPSTFKVLTHFVFTAARWTDAAVLVLQVRKLRL